MVLKESEFREIRGRVYDYCGINLHEGKQALVRARVMKRVRKLQLNNFSQYIEYLEEDSSGNEFLALVDVLTTNKTSFFRENQHFQFMRKKVIPEIKGRKVRWWSAGCSTGEEPVSCAIALLEQQIPATDVKILATDLSREVLQVARRGIYHSKHLENIPPKVRKQYFQETDQGQYQISKQIKGMLTYGRLNLKSSWPLSGPFHVIMCRNVMIYFDRQTQIELVSRFYDLLEPGGYLFLGHSESVANTNRGFQNIQPAVYKK